MKKISLQHVETRRAPSLRRSALSMAAAVMMLFATGAGAQVTIGSGDVPQKYSVLELISHNKLGVRLPQIETTDLRDDILTDAEKTNPLSQGLQIYNLETRCVETWNGSVWIQACSEDGPYVPPAEPILITCGDQSIAVPEFMPYNLGANPDYDTPKKQMEYLATHPSNDIDGNVYGGRYQWGRKDDGYAIGANFTLYKDAASAAQITATATYDSNGQILEYSAGNSAVGKHIYSNNTYRYDWSIEQNDGLWANGDPCPDGFRLPTQDEWERLGNYDCKPTVAGGSVSTSGGVGNSSTGFTWVPVVCASGSCYHNSTWRTSSSQSGYAIYKTDVWNDISFDKFNLVDANDPEPFLFLPAAGYRNIDSGDIKYVGSQGYYWSGSLPGGDSTHSLYFYSANVNLSSDSPRAAGCSVRCVKH